MKKLIILFLMMLMIIPMSYSLAIDDDFLLVLDGTNTDISNYGRSQISGSPATETTCGGDQCLDFDGSTQYNEYSGLNSNITENMTFLIQWYKDTATSGDFISSYISGGGNGGFSSLVLNTGSCLVYYGGFSSYNCGTQNINEWKTFALVFNKTDSNLQIYQNGTLTNSTSVSITNSGHSFHIGKTRGGGNFFDGKIQKLAIINRSLTQAEVTDFQTNGFTLTPTIQTNLSNVYATQSFSVSFDTSTNVNMSIYLDGVSILNASNTNSAIHTFSGISLGSHTLQSRSQDSKGYTWNNETFEIQPYQYFRFTDSDTGNPLSGYTFGGISDVNNLTTLDARNYSFGINTLTFTKHGYSQTNLNILFNNTMQINNTYTVSPAKLLIYIRDQDTNDIITGINFSVEIIATISTSTSTTTGLVNLTNVLFQNEEYVVIVSNPIYQTESVYFDFTNQEILTLNVYMINATSPNLGTVFVKPVDNFGNPIVGATVKALQWDSISSSYKEVSQSKTGSDGLGTLNIILNNKFYIFSAENDGSRANSTAEIIDTTENNKVVTIVLSALAQEYTYLFENVFTDITESFNNVTNISTISFQWEDDTGISRTVCINSYRSLRGSESLLTTNCTSGVSGIYTLNFLINGSYKTILKGEILENGIYYTMDKFSYEPSNSVPKLFDSLGLAMFVVPILFLGSIAIAMMIQNTSIGTILIMVSAGVSLLIAPDILTQSIVAFLFFMGWLTINYGVKPR